MVGLVVISFFGVVIKLGSTGQLPWSDIISGFVPNLSLLIEPAEVYIPFLKETGEFRSFGKARL